MSSSSDVLIVGASLAGVATAEHLRRLDPDRRIVVLGDEARLPYDRPPLSKAVLRDPTFDLETLSLQSAAWFEEQRIGLRRGCAVALDAGRRVVITDDGREWRYDELVVATGSRARRIETAPASEKVRYLRSLDEAVDLARRLADPGRLGIIGAGFMGLELAASARSLGWTVSLVEQGPAPLARVLPVELAERIWRTYAEQGVSLHANSALVGVREGEDRVQILLSDRPGLDVDLVLVCAGGLPNAEWLGLGEPERGVICDAWGRSALPHVSAVGDVASWDNLHCGTNARVEQWQAAKEQAVIVANRLAGVRTEGWGEAPYFWSDLIAGRIQFVGTAPPDALVHTIEPRPGKAVSLVGHEGRLVGVLTERFPRGIGMARPLLGTPWAEAVRWADGLEVPARLSS